MAGSSRSSLSVMMISKRTVYLVKPLWFRYFSVGDQMKHDKGSVVDQKLLDILVCPLSKKPLRYDSTTSELISDEIGVAFQIQNGIPNLIPTDGRLQVRKDTSNTDKPDVMDKNK